MIQPTVVVIEFCALADSGQMQRYLREHAPTALPNEAQLLTMFLIYAGDAALVSHAFPFHDPDKENVPQMLPCPN
ncbi:MAG TPA: hypothetical protein VGQ76_23840 [Thermoanaerobaculia bacterium]|nr:hypothetical protein [Thermoanaerobaculia bacterium]